MLKFTRMESLCGIPIFYQKLPEIIKGTAIALTVFTGAADDTSVGEPGIYHWFEHVPFRGTKNFPGGYMAIKGSLTRVGGSLGAWTNWFATNYWATMPTRHTTIGMDIVFDLVAEPLLTDEAIIAEREIINQEIRDQSATMNGKVQYLLPSILWQDHPVSNPILGSIESLGSMTPDLLRKAREMGYDRSRMVFFISTALEASEVLKMVNSRIGSLPDHGLSERRMGSSFGSLAGLWEKGKRTEIPSFSSSSLVKVYFWAPPITTMGGLMRQASLGKIFNQGSIGSPLMRAVRENKPLCYGAGVERFNCQDGGYWGFSVSTSKENVEAVLEALPTMLQDPQLRSKSWFEDIKQAAIGNMEMEVMDPDALVDSAIRRTIALGEPFSEEEMFPLVRDLSHEEMLRWIDEIDFSEARTIVLR